VHGRILGKIGLKVKFTFSNNFAIMQSMKSMNEKIAVEKNIP